LDVPKDSTTVRVWRVRTGREVDWWTVSTPDGDAHVVTCLAFSADGRTLATGHACDSDVHLWELASGREYARLRGHQGPVRSLVSSPDGATLASGSDDNTILIWDLQRAGHGRGRMKSRQTDKELAELWVQLGDPNPMRARAALRALVAVPHQSLPLVRSRLKPVPVPDPKRLVRLISQLGDDDFAVRRAATRELARLGEASELALLEALQRESDLEIRLRVKKLLAELRPQGIRSERLRELRAIELLERLGTHEARTVLEALARGAPGVRLTWEAQAALARLRRGCMP
jgi:hypothetical protein